MTAEVLWGKRKGTKELVKVSSVSFRRHAGKPSISGYRQRKDGSWFKRDTYIGSHWELA